MDNNTDKRFIKNTECSENGKSIHKNFENRTINTKDVEKYLKAKNLLIRSLM